MKEKMLSYLQRIGGSRHKYWYLGMFFVLLSTGVLVGGVLLTSPGNAPQVLSLAKHTKQVSSPPPPKAVLTLVASHAAQILISPFPNAKISTTLVSTPSLTLAPNKPTTSDNFQPSAPYYATFFYPWYETQQTNGHWSQWSDNGHTPPTNWFSEYLPDPNPGVFDPATELYSSTNDAIIYWQLQKLKEAKQEVAISSWWGQGHKTDTAFRKIITDVMKRSDNPYPRLRWTVYYEKDGFTNISLAEIVSDLNYIKANYTTQNGYFKINGKPVLFVYNAAHAGSNPLDDLAKWQAARDQTGFYINLKADPLNAGAAPSAIDSWHEYAPANRTNSREPFWQFVSPGFWLNGSPERLGRNAGDFETSVKAMVSANVTWKLTETWNEWGEGTGVEPAEQVNQTTSGQATLKTDGYPFKNLYIDILNRNLPNLE